LAKEHRYLLEIEWTGNRGTGTSAYNEYDRSHTIRTEGKTELQASSDTAFRGDKSKYNPEEFLVMSISSCHMLWYLHLCADAGIVVTSYVDKPEGIMVEDPVNGGRFTNVTLHPEIALKDLSRRDEADALHHTARKKCFISNSCNFEILHAGTYRQS